MRLSISRLSPGPQQHLAAVKKELEAGTLGPALSALIWARASQMNGCGYCLGSYSKALLAAGDTQERLDALAGWRDSALFSDKEKSALAFTEALTNVQTAGAPDSVYVPLRAHFEDKAIAELTLAIALINAFNRIIIGMGA
jgi:AhpD family alkylhydroperoxidase